MHSTNKSKTSNDIKSKQIQQRYQDYRKKRRRPCHVALVPTLAGDHNSARAASSSSSYGFISLIGRRRVMEDTVKLVPGLVAPEQPCGGYDFFAVYDGHGGTFVANACRDRLHLLVAEEVRESAQKELDWCQIMRECFSKMDREIGVGSRGGGDGEGEGEGDGSGNTMGSTAAVVVVGKDEIVVANCGDSRAVLCRGGVAVPLSRDHKPDRPDEKERIEAAGGRVIEWNGNRVLGVLATSRSIGDHCMKPFVICKPETSVYERTEWDEFVVVASDGLWDVVSNKFVCEVVRNCYAQTRTYASEAAAMLAELAMARGSKDNISVIVIQLNTT
ncbi:hypothetical protein Fmac_001965 [Flemingia macrophylla]|uniref:protein-serine/threonine phosphatase n=1 Tax=Flemingia macrophylla TaxID=520843 RepID=A0ABD1NIL1_9FABA